MAESQLCWENRNLTSAENLKLAMARKPTLSSSILVVYPHLNQGKWGFPLSTIPTQVELHGRWWSIRPVKNIQHLWHLQIKKQTKPVRIRLRDFPRFIVIESLEEVCLAKLLPFLIKKVIKTRATPKNIKRTRNGNLLVEVDSWRQAENIKMKIFQTTKWRPYHHEKHSKGVIRSRELILATEEMLAALGKQGVKHKKNQHLKRRRKNWNHPDIQQTPYSQGSEDWLSSWEGWTVCLNSPEVLQI